MRRMVTLAVLLALGLTACSSGGGEALPSRVEQTTSTTRAPPSTTGSLPDLSDAPRITRFTGPRSPIECSSPTSIELHWETPVTATVELRIDRGDVFATYPGGRGDHLVPLECDGRPQTYELTVTGADGKAATKSLTIEEQLPT